MMYATQSNSTEIGGEILPVFETGLPPELTATPDAKLVRQRWTFIDLIVVAGTGLAAIIFFYSGAFMNWPGLTGLYKTFDAWFKTGSQGAGHEKAWWYWLMLIARYEQPVLVGLVLC